MIWSDGEDELQARTEFVREPCRACERRFAPRPSVWADALEMLLFAALILAGAAAIWRLP